MKFIGAKRTKKQIKTKPYGAIKRRRKPIANTLMKARMKGDSLMGLLLRNDKTNTLHTVLNTPIKPLNGSKEKELNPSLQALAAINAGFR